MGVPVARSQTRTVLSSLPEMATGRPFSSVAATAFTGPLWPVRGLPMGVPVARSQTRTVSSPLPEMTTGRPFSSATVTSLTHLPWPAITSCRLSSCQEAHSGRQVASSPSAVIRSARLWARP